MAASALDAVDRLALRLLEEKDGLAVLGLCGAQGSGKSTLAQALLARMGARGVASAGAGRARAGPRSGPAGDAEPSQAERSASCREKHAEPPAACGSGSIVLRRRAPRTPPLPRLPQNFFSRWTGV